MSDLNLAAEGALGKECGELETATVHKQVDSLFFFFFFLREGKPVCVSVSGICFHGKFYTFDCKLFAAHRVVHTFRTRASLCLYAWPWGSRYLNAPAT